MRTVGEDPPQQQGLLCCGCWSSADRNSSYGAANFPLFDDPIQLQEEQGSTPAPFGEHEEVSMSQLAELPSASASGAPSGASPPAPAAAHDTPRPLRPPPTPRRELVADVLPAGEFRIVLDKSGGHKLGLRVGPADDPKLQALKVTSIDGGLAATWNLCHKSREVKVNDYIIEVNGATGEVPKLVAECRKHTILCMRVKRSREGTAPP